MIDIKQKILGIFVVILFKCFLIKDRPIDRQQINQIRYVDFNVTSTNLRLEGCNVHAKFYVVPLHSVVYSFRLRAYSLKPFYRILIR